MALTKQAWSLNALSVELGIDRRTLGKRLDGLHPIETGPLGNKLYALHDVIQHLRCFEAASSNGHYHATDEPVIPTHPMTYGGLMGMVMTAHMIGQNLPRILRQFTGCSPERALDVADLVMLMFAGYYDEWLDSLEHYDGPEPKVPDMEWHGAEGRKKVLVKLKALKPESEHWTLRGDESHG